MLCYAIQVKQYELYLEKALFKFQKSDQKNEKKVNHISVTI